MSRENTKSNTENVLEISNLCVEYRTRDSVVKAVNGLDLTLKKGQALGVVGETGAGKTTTTLMLLRLTEPTAGGGDRGEDRSGRTGRADQGRQIPAGNPRQAGVHDLPGPHDLLKPGAARK